jgi:SAM-dependent methyltransferase
VPEPLDAALAEIRDALLDPGLRRAVAAGRRRGAEPAWVRVELRPVILKGVTHLQIVAHDGARPRTTNVASGAEAEAAVDGLVAEAFGNWHVATDRVTLQVRVTKKGDAQVHRGAPASGSTRDDGHDREKEHLLDPADPLYGVIGGTAAKRRQVDAFLRALRATLPPADQLPRPLRIADLGCGNAYLTFAAYRYLSGQGAQVEVAGVDLRPDQRARNATLADHLDLGGRISFVASTIADVDLPEAPHVVLALHACDTATDEALARAVRWQAPWILAAPCCHHDIAAQLRTASPPPPYQQMMRHGILRERFADVLTDTLRASLLRLYGYRVDVVEFVDSQHTPRNLLIRARRTDTAPSDAQRAEYDDLVRAWSVTPRLATLLELP